MKGIPYHDRSVLLTNGEKGEGKIPLQLGSLSELSRAAKGAGKTNAAISKSIDRHASTQVLSVGKGAECVVIDLLSGHLSQHLAALAS
jgi:hypothetical protein